MCTPVTSISFKDESAARHYVETAVPERDRSLHVATGRGNSRVFIDYLVKIRQASERCSPCMSMATSVSPATAANDALAILGDDAELTRVDSDARRFDGNDEGAWDPCRRQ